MADGDPRLGGLLSKVAKFVRNPTKDWSELDEKDSVADSAYSKEALKEMIERKRQNDFVRKREFDHLRKLRRREPHAHPEPGRPSFFQSSLTSNHDDRAETLKKIDEIEAQMSRQWWKGKEGATRPANASTTTTSPSRIEAGPTQAPDVPAGNSGPGSVGPGGRQFQPTEPASIQNVPATATAPAPTSAGVYASTMPYEGATTVPAETLQRGSLGFPAADASRWGAPAPSSRHAVGAEFSTQRLYAHAPTDNLTDPDLEDAAIRFANGDVSGAEGSLMNALSGSDLRPDLAEVWMSAVFDLYRITGQQARFDQVALDFANRFGRSAPAWFSLPDLQGRRKGGVAPAPRPVAASDSRPADWTCPATLSQADLLKLESSLDAPGSLVIDWQHLTGIHGDAIPDLGRLLARWCATPVDLLFRGHESLERALQAQTPSGDRGVPMTTWQVRLDALRVMRLQDAFELVALDFCVTYEVSPPSWQEPRGLCTLEGYVDPEEAEAADIRSHWDEPRSRWDDPLGQLTAPATLGEEAPALAELYGEIVGDAIEVVGKLERTMGKSSRLVVSCARLIRVDFSAAGSLLNWAAQQQGLGNQIQFRDVNHMVAAFFNVIGISEYARVVPRTA